MSSTLQKISADFQILTYSTSIFIFIAFILVMVMVIISPNQSSLLWSSLALILGGLILPWIIVFITKPIPIMYYLIIILIIIVIDLALIISAFVILIVYISGMDHTTPLFGLGVTAIILLGIQLLINLFGFIIILIVAGINKLIRSTIKTTPKKINRLISKKIPRKMK